MKNVFDNCFNKPLYLLGDFNVNVLKNDNNKGAKSFVDLIFQYGSLPTINKPTRVTRNISTAIDIIITNTCINNNLETGIIKTDITDHFPIFLIDYQNNIRNNRLKNDEKIHVRHYSDINLKRLKQILSEHDWSFLCTSKDAD